MSEKLRFQCPECGNVMKVPNVEGVMNKTFTCNVCGKRHKIGDCKILGVVNDEVKIPQPVPNPDPTPKPKPYAEVGDIIKLRCRGRNGTCTKVLAFTYQVGAENAVFRCPECDYSAPGREWKRIGGPSEVQIALLRRKDNNQTYQLSEGKNLIGRKSSTSTATIQIETNDTRLSREHFVIDVNPDTADGYSYTFHLNREKVNTTKIDGNRIQYGQMVLMKNGMEIELPGLTVFFEIPGQDNDNTQMDQEQTSYCEDNTIYGG